MSQSRSSASKVVLRRARLAWRGSGLAGSGLEGSGLADGTHCGGLMGDGLGGGLGGLFLLKFSILDTASITLLCWVVENLHCSQIALFSIKVFRPL